MNRVMRRGRSGTIGGANARIILRPAPRETHARIADGVALHLVNGHLGRMAMDKLDEAAAFARRDLDVGDFAKPLEERSKLIFRYVARETANEDCGVVWVRKLIHRLRSHRTKVRLVVATVAAAVAHVPAAHLITTLDGPRALHVITAVLTLAILMRAVVIRQLFRA